MERDVIDFLEAEARAEDRTLEYVIRRALKEYVERKRREAAPKAGEPERG